MEKTMEVEVTDINTVEADPLAVYRAQVAEEKNAPKSKASTASLERLRAISEQSKTEAIELERFNNALKSVTINTENLTKLISRCSTDQSNLSRRTVKLEWHINAGYRLGVEINTPYTVAYFSNLTPDEIRLSDARFASEWNEAAAKKTLEDRTKRGFYVVSGEAKVSTKPCASGSKCLKAYKRVPAPAAGTGKYCTKNCAASAVARAKREKQASPEAK
jgi:hypothetical protein